MLARKASSEAHKQGAAANRRAQSGAGGDAASRPKLRRFRLLERSRDDMMRAAREARDAAYLRSLAAYAPTRWTFTHGLSDSVKRSRDGIRDFFVSQAWIAPVVFVLNLSFASMVTTAWGVFNCLSYTINGVRYMATDLSVRCDDSTHKIGEAVGVLVIIAFVAGIPLLFRQILIKNAHKLKETQVYMRYGFAYDGYKLDPEKGLFAWESVVMTRKAVVVMIGALLTSDAYYQTFASLVLLIICLVLHSSYQPYASDRFNRLEALLLWSIICTVLVSLFYLRYESIIAPCLGASDSLVIDKSGLTCGEANVQKQRSDLAVTIILVILNFGVIAYMVWNLLRSAYLAFKARAKENKLNAVERRVFVAAKQVRKSVHARMRREKKAAPVFQLPMSPTDARLRSTSRMRHVMIPAYAVKSESASNLHQLASQQHSQTHPHQPFQPRQHQQQHFPLSHTPQPATSSGGQPILLTRTGTFTNPVHHSAAARSRVSHDDDEDDSFDDGGDGWGTDDGHDDVADGAAEDDDDEWDDDEQVQSNSNTDSGSGSDAFSFEDVGDDEDEEDDDQHHRVAIRQ